VAERGSISTSRGDLMEDNPYSLLAQIMRPGTGRQIALYRGRVIKASPLEVDVAGITVSGAELMVNAEMVPYAADLDLDDVSGGLNGQAVSGSLNAAAQIRPTLAAGDTVLLLTEDQQLFYILCKVVSV